MKNIFCALTLLVLVLSSACQSTVDKAMRDTKYSAYEMVGIEKRDLLKKYVRNTKESQEQTKDAFIDALDQLKKTYSFDGGKLERQYDALNSSYQSADKRASQVHADIIKVENVAGDLFKEWEKEIGEIQTQSLKVKSRQQLAATQNKFGGLRRSLKKSETKIQPALLKLKDQVLFLKHNLNAKAIASLKGESLRIESEIASLVEAMKVSIHESEQFIQEIE